ncbi:MAG: general secretion pathway protein GspK [Desulfobacterales bacterium]
MPIKVLKNNRGIALLVTLSVVTVMVAASLEMNKKARSAIFSAAATRDRITLLHMASSGVNVAEEMLIKDKYSSNSDSLQEDWADSEKCNEIMGDIPFERGSVTVSISDELGKIQINSLVQYPKGLSFNESQRVMWERFLNLLKYQNEAFEDLEPMTIINSVKDWIDSGDDDAITGLNGAESEYYQDLDPPYPCKNGPLTNINELALVRGVTPELFRGAGGEQGLSRYITVFGMTQSQDNAFTYEGKININTADLPTLSAIMPPGAEELAQVMFDYRNETSESGYLHDLTSPKWYKGVPGMGDITIDPNLITTSSDIFRIESTATLMEMKMKITAVIKREQSSKTGKWICSILRWEIA